MEASSIKASAEPLTDGPRVDLVSENCVRRDYRIYSLLCSGDRIFHEWDSN